MSFQPIHRLSGLAGRFLATMLLLLGHASGVLAQQAAGERAAGERADAEEGPWWFDGAQTSLSQNTVIASPFSGVVDDVNVTEGQTVRREMLLVQLNPELGERELAAARAAFEAARLESGNDVGVRYAKRTLQVREHKLRQSHLANDTYAGAVTAMELEELRLEVDQAALAIEQAEHDLRVSAAKAAEHAAEMDIAQARLGQHSIRSPISGMVVQIDVQAGEWVEAGKPLARIISLDPMRVECLVDGRRYGRELIGRDVTFTPTDSRRDEVYHGEVVFVSPELHPVTGQVRLWATLRNPDGTLGAGTPGRLAVR